MDSVNSHSTLVGRAGHQLPWRHDADGIRLIVHLDVLPTARHLPARAGAGRSRLGARERLLSVTFTDDEVSVVCEEASRRPTPSFARLARPARVAARPRIGGRACRARGRPPAPASRFPALDLRHRPILVRDSQLADADLLPASGRARGASLSAGRFSGPRKTLRRSSAPVAASRHATCDGGSSRRPDHGEVRSTNAEAGLVTGVAHRAKPERAPLPGASASISRRSNGYETNRK